MTTDYEIRKIRIGGREYDKPFDPGCAVCRSPWHLQIDEMLASGYSARAIRQFFRYRRPSCPQPDIVLSHIGHLALPHQQMRAQLEKSSKDRGASEDETSLVRVPDAVQAVIQRGYERLATGELEVGGRDMLRAINLQLQIDKQAQEGQVDAQAYQEAMMELIELVQRYLSPAQWRSFVNDAYSSPKMRSIIAGQQPQPVLPNGQEAS